MITTKTVLCTALLLAGGGSSAAQSPTDNDTARALAAEFKSAPSQYKHMLNCFGTSGHHATRDRFVCPVGDAQEEVIKLGTHSTYGNHLDFRKTSYLPMPAAAWVCASNGFVQLENDYTPEELIPLKSVTEDAAYQLIFAQKHASHYLAAKFRQTAGDSPSKTYWHLLQASAEADNCRAPLRYEIYAREAMNAMKAGLKTTEKTEQDYWVWQIALPNFHRRLGDFDAASAWLDANETDLPSKDAFDPDYYTLAKQVLRKAIEQKDTKSVAINKRYLEEATK